MGDGSFAPWGLKMNAATSTSSLLPASAGLGVGSAAMLRGCTNSHLLGWVPAPARAPPLRHTFMDSSLPQFPHLWNGPNHSASLVQQMLVYAQYPEQVQHTVLCAMHTTHMIHASTCLLSPPRLCKRIFAGNMSHVYTDTRPRIRVCSILVLSPETDLESRIWE